MNRITVLLFANLKELAGTSNLSLEIDDQSRLSDLKQLLAEKIPALASSITSAIASQNQKFIFDQDLLEEGAEIAFFPPVSGGAEPITICKIILDELDFQALQEDIVNENTGAVCTFTGIVRGVTSRDQKITTSLEYEAYIPMAEQKMHQVAREMRDRWPAIDGIAIVQRIGKLQPGTPTVAIMCAASHRDSGVFEAARFGIDRLKEIVPVWKKEISPAGSSWVEGHYRPSKKD